jgi:isopropylmalate/homocitrate/citramalate synthase
LRATDPVNSPAINEVSTAAYFNDPGLFKPFDPESFLGVSQEIVLTHLANKKIIEAAAKELGVELKTEQLEATLAWVKRYAYENNISKIPQEQFKFYLDSLLNE